MDAIKINQISLDKSDCVNLGFAICFAAATRAFTHDSKAVAVVGASAFLAGKVADFVRSKPVNAFSCKPKPLASDKPDLFLKLDSNLNPPPLPDFSSQEIEDIVTKSTGLQPAEDRNERTGTQGAVNKWYNDEKKCFAVKIIRPVETNRDWMGLDKGEINAIKMPDHPNILKARKLIMADADKRYFVVESKDDIPAGHPKELYIIASIYDWVEGQDLFEQLKNQQIEKTPDTICRVCLDLCEALKFLHQNGMVHRDVKPENIMFKDGRYQLIDFGLSKYIGEQATQTPCGTVELSAPELYTRHDHRIDIWNVGILILEMVSAWIPGNYPHLTEPAKQETRWTNARDFANLTDEQRAEFLKDKLSGYFKKSPELLDLSISILKKQESRPGLEYIENRLREIQDTLG